MFAVITILTDYAKEPLYFGHTSDKTYKRMDAFPPDDASLKRKAGTDRNGTRLSVNRAGRRPAIQPAPPPSRRLRDPLETGNTAIVPQAARLPSETDTYDRNPFKFP
jgi:hypothetical protein